MDIDHTGPQKCVDCGEDAYIRLADTESYVCAHCFADRGRAGSEKAAPAATAGGSQLSSKAKPAATAGGSQLSSKAKPAATASPSPLTGSAEGAAQ